MPESLDDLLARIEALQRDVDRYATEVLAWLTPDPELLTPHPQSFKVEPPSRHDMDSTPRKPQLPSSDMFDRPGPMDARTATQDLLLELHRLHAKLGRTIAELERRLELAAPDDDDWNNLPPPPRWPPE